MRFLLHAVVLSRERARWWSSSAHLRFEAELQQNMTVTDCILRTGGVGSTGLEAPINRVSRLTEEKQALFHLRYLPSWGQASKHWLGDAQDVGTHLILKAAVGSTGKKKFY